MYFLSSFLFFFLAANAQPRAISLPKEQFDKHNVEISGLGVYNNNLLALSEGCSMLFVIPLEGDNCGKKCTEITLEGKATKNLEGLAVYNNFIFVTNENDPAQVQYGRLDNVGASNTVKLHTVAIKSNNGEIDLSRNTGDYGMEGITVDAKNGIAYVMKERSTKGDGKNCATLWAFSISTSGDGVTFTHKNTTKIEIGGNSKYSDICFHNGKLYCIRSKGSGLYIDVISSPEGLGNSISLGNTEIRSVSITDQVKALKGDNSNQLEGIAIIGDKIYLISDTGTGGCGKDAKHGTLLLEWPMI